MTVRRVRPGHRQAAWLLVGAGLASAGLGACGSSADGDATGTAWADDCAGERPGPMAVVGMDTADGQERWSRTLGAMTNSFDAGGVLVVMDIAGEAIGIDAATGAALWCRPGTGPVDTTQAPAGATSAVAGTTVVTLEPSDTLVAFDARTGRDLWSTPAPATTIAFPQIRGDRILLVDNVVDATYAGQPADVTNPVVATFDLATGARVDGPAEVKMMEFETEDDRSLVRQVLGPEPYQVTVIVSDPVTGAERWRLTRHGVGAWPVGDLIVFVDQPGDPSPSAAGSVTDELIAYSATDGTPLWSVHMDAASPFVLPGGEVVLWSSDSEAVAMETATGAVRWRVDHGSPGEGGDATEPGRYVTFVPSADGATVAGVIIAQQPYRD